MSYCSIKNVARVVDVRQWVPVDSLSVSNDKKIQPDRVECTKNSNFNALPVAVQKNDAAVSDPTQVMTKLTALLSSFFTQLITLMSGIKEKTAPDIPAPQPRPEVLPRVVPEPDVPGPAPSATIPGLSNKRNGVKPDDIWSGFRQGPDGNCVTVSAIKAAMYRFGQSPTDIYKQVIKVSDGYRVVMRDDFQLTLTDRELFEGARSSRFTGRDQGMLKDARFLFAVSAKRAQMENNDHTAGRSYQAAVRSLNNGEDETGPGEGFLRLGLRKHMKRVSVRALAAGQVGMCNRAGHSVAVVNGCEERWGRQGPAPTRGHAVALV